MTHLSRRAWLYAASGFGLAAAIAGACPASAASGSGPQKFEVDFAESEWRKRLTAAQYAVLREDDTEAPFSSPLDQEKRAGRFGCAGCGLALFSSRTKFDSGTGWPSFWQPEPDAVIERPDHSYGMVRVDVRCRRCGGHLGHVFDDGPQPTGLRYCMNGVALVFQPDSKS